MYSTWKSIRILVPRGLILNVLYSYLYFFDFQIDQSNVVTFFGFLPAASADRSTIVFCNPVVVVVGVVLVLVEKLTFRSFFVQCNLIFDVWSLVAQMYFELSFFDFIRSFKLLFFYCF